MSEAASLVPEAAHAHAPDAAHVPGDDLFTHPPGPVVCEVGRSRARAVDLWARRVAIGAALASVGSFAVGVLGGPWWLVWVGMVAGVAAAAGVFRLAVSVARPRLLPARYTLHDTFIEVLRGHERFVVGRAGITAAWREEPEGDLHIDLESGEELILRVPEADRQRLGRVLGVGKGARVVRAGLASGARGPIGRAAAVVGILGLSPAWLIFAIAVAMGAKDLSSSGSVLGMAFCVSIVALLSFAMWSLLRLLRRRDVVVGADGLYLPDAGVFVPIAKLERADAYADGVRVTRRDGQTLVLRLHESRGSADFARAQGALLKSLRDAIAVAGTPQSPKLEALDRFGRDATGWKSALEALHAGDGNYRVVSVTDDELEKVIGDSSSTAERRVGAAVALATRSPDRARARVRVLVPTVVDEGLREALERAAEGEIDEPYLARAMRR